MLGGMAALQLLITIAVMTVIIAITAGLFARNHSIRILVGGLGLALLPLALYLTGLLALTVNGIASLIAWAHRTGWTDSMSWGAGLGALGIVMLLTSGFLPKGEKVVKAPKSKPVGSGKKDAIGAGQQPAAPTASAKPTPPKAAPTATKSSEFDEIEELLKKRGIN